MHTADGRRKKGKLSSGTKQSVAHASARKRVHLCVQRAELQHIVQGCSLDSNAESPRCTGELIQACQEESFTSDSLCIFPHVTQPLAEHEQTLI